MTDDTKTELVRHTPSEVDDEDATSFDQLIADIAALKDDDTVVEHMDPAAYRKGKRT